VDGRTYQISGRYTVPLPTFRNAELGITYSHAFSAGFDYKYDKNSLLFGGLNTPLTLYDVDQFVMVYDGRFKDPYGEFIINDQLTVSPGNMGGNNNDAAFSAAHPGGNSDYVYNTLKLQRLTRLPWNFTLALRGTFQSSNDNLPVSEQLAFGGWDTIRGYDSREINADDGYYFTTELRSPTFSLGKLFRSERFQDQLQLLTFWDAGSAYSHALQPGEPTEIGLSSVGFGLRYSINDYLSMRFDFGAQLVNTSLDNDHGSASNLGIVLSY
jgi:hemolysin activation/secretion protein